MTRTPASAPNRPASAQPSVSTRPILTPSSRATPGLNAVARSRRPTGVYSKTRNSASAAASTAAAVNRSDEEIPSPTDPTFRPRSEKAAGNDRYWPP